MLARVLLFDLFLLSSDFCPIHAWFQTDANTYISPKPCTYWTEIRRKEKKVE